MTPKEFIKGYAARNPGRIAIETRRYPILCTRCGMCCLHEPCIIAEGQAGSKDAALGFDGRCRYLWAGFNEGRASCLLMLEMVKDEDPEVVAEIKAAFGMGAGCCIKATARNSETGESCRFSELPPEIKRKLAIIRATPNMANI